MHCYEENHKLTKRDAMVGFGEVTTERQEVQDAVDEKPLLIEFESGNVEVQ